MRISIFGMGYVGVVSTACLLRDGHEVVGVDPVEAKVRDLDSGRTPIQEPGVAEMLVAGYEAGRLRATSDPKEGVDRCDMVWVCVGTPSLPDGGINLSSVEAATRQIGAAFRGVEKPPLFVLRSTSLPGTSRQRIIPILEKASGLSAAGALRVVFHPEFLREGTAVYDFDHPPKIVIGESKPGDGDQLIELYDRYEAPRFRVELGEAEFVKYCDNLFHAVKVTFANEVGAMARAVGVDARRVADMFCADTKLNISPYYLRPGFAFGGSCLPKDMRAMMRHASVTSVRMPMLEGVMQSNDLQVNAFVKRVLSHNVTSVGLVGLAFKPNTDDMRESAYVRVAKQLIGEGLSVRIYDPGVDPNRLIGSNKEAVQAALRHLESLLVPTLNELRSCQLILVNHPIVNADDVEAWLAAGIRVIDLVGISGVPRDSSGYEGIAW